MNFISPNIRFLRKQKKWTQNDLAVELNIKRSLVGAYEEGRANPNYELLQDLSALFRLSIDTLITKDLSLTGKVPLFDSNQMKEMEAGNLKVLTITVDEKQNENIELVPVKAAAGYLNGYADPVFIKELNRFKLPFLPAGTFRAFEITGDSMLPVQPGSVIVGEYVDDFNRLKDGETYIIISKEEGIVFKRIFKKNTTEGIVVLRSDNPSYPPYEIELKEVVEIWRAVVNISYVNKGTDMSFKQIKQIMQGINASDN
jgi:transcriptional regulator with XRE-family HTH domain